MPLFIPHRCPKCFESVTLIQPQKNSSPIDTLCPVYQFERGCVELLLLPANSRLQMPQKIQVNLYPSYFLCYFSIRWQGCQSGVLHRPTHGKMVKALVTHVLNPKYLMDRIIKKTSYTGTTNSANFCL